MVNTLVQRASAPQMYTEENWEKILYVTCAVIQKYRHDKNLGDENIMEWELDTKDRSFQFGRLLAIMDWIEGQYYYYSKENESKENGDNADNADNADNEDNNANNKQKDNEKKHRQTNAMRGMTLFCQRSMRQAGYLTNILVAAYIPRVPQWCSDKFWKMFEDIWDKLRPYSKEELAKPLEDVYLIGYALQRKECFKIPSKEENNNR